METLTVINKTVYTRDVPEESQGCNSLTKRFFHILDPKKAYIETRVNFASKNVKSPLNLQYLI